MVERRMELEIGSLIYRLTRSVREESDRQGSARIEIASRRVRGRDAGSP